VLLEQVGRGALDPAEALTRLATLVPSPATHDLGYARLDLDRAARQGFPEVVYGQGKSPLQIAEIAECLTAAGQPLLVTRTDADAYAAVSAVVPDARFHPDARAITRARADTPRGRGTVLVAMAGTADLPVAEEAAVAADVMGNDVSRLYDVGVAGLHRLLDNRGHIDEARIIIVVAGMDGALPGVVGGLVKVPVIAVPTSAGYGASFGGLAALLSMLNSCASGVAVVNIDNGFGAAAIASRINHL